MIELLASIEGKDRKGRPFCAGIVLWNDVTVVTAPILRRALARKTRREVREICERNGWKVSVVHQIERADERPGREYRR